tara:strand:- start:92987 stop:93463 length:477 start_codon:yes stop_codon:yes gene_type:complete
MLKSFQLRKLIYSDHLVAREVYRDAIESQGHIFYTKEQIQAWSGLAHLPGVLDRPLKEGKGWVISSNQVIQAFGLRYPMDRLALLYCRGAATHQGYGTALVNQLESDARKEGQLKLFTEASFFSYSLFLKRDWTIISIEKIKIANIPFDRYLMEKILV